MKKTETPQACIELLRALRPDVVITVTREIDSRFSWDGDGPDPRDEGFSPYDVTVTASAIRNGVLYEGTDTLGGSYYQPDEPLNEVHGYLPQMVDEAMENLDDELVRAGFTVDSAWVDALKGLAIESYNAQRAEIEAKR